MTSSLFSTSTTSASLVVGATGATGKHVVQLLLDQGQKVKVIARSKERMLTLLKSEDYGDRLTIMEASVLDLSDEELSEQIHDCQAVISCLGHNVDFHGIFGHPRRLVTDATKRLTKVIIDHNKDSTVNPKTKYILMGTVAVPHPDGTDDIRSVGERMILFLLRYLIPPHADNEDATAYLYHSVAREDLEWSIVRPTDLINGDEVSPYTIFEKPQDPLFGGTGVATRINVAHFMVELALDNKTWNQHKFKLPVLHDKPTTSKDESNKNK